MSEPHDYIGLSAATSSSSCSSSPNPAAAAAEAGPRLTLRLGLPASDSPDRHAPAPAAALTLGLKPAAKRAFPDASPRRAAAAEKAPPAAPPAAKAQVVGWPPVRNYRKNMLAASVSKSKGAEDGGAAAQGGPCYVKVSMDDAPYLRKVDLKIYGSYDDLSAALQKMFSCFINGSIDH